MKKALIIEDEPNYGLLLRMHLGTIFSPDEITVVSSWAEAKEALRVPPPAELITLDLNLEDIRGLDTLAKAKELRAACPDGVIIILTGAVEGTKEQAIAMGADDFITKQEMIALPPAASQSPSGGIIERLWQCFDSLKKNPVSYQRSGHVLEKWVACLKKTTKAEP